MVQKFKDIRILELIVNNINFRNNDKSRRICKKLKNI